MSDNHHFSEITVKELAQQMAENCDSVQLVDVREPEEISFASISGFQVFPLSQFAQWNTRIFTCLNPQIRTIVLCHHGIRSAQMCQWLMSQGFTQVNNVSGGIDAYSRIVDSSIPRY